LSTERTETPREELAPGVVFGRRQGLAVLRRVSEGEIKFVEAVYRPRKKPADERMTENPEGA